MPTRIGGFETIYSKDFLEVTVAHASFTESIIEDPAVAWPNCLGDYREKLTIGGPPTSGN